MVGSMRVVYPYCFTCGVTRAKPEEQIILHQEKNQRCYECEETLAWAPRSVIKSYDCPECNGPKSWNALRCKYCYLKIRILPKNQKSEDFRKRIRERISEIADEMGQTNYWKSSSN